MPVAESIIHRSLRRILFILVGCLLMACSKSDDDLLKTTLDAEKAAETARLNGDPKSAKKASATASKAAAALAKTLERQPTNVILQQAVAKAQSAQRSAKRHAEISDQEHQRAKLMQSLRVRAYQKTRSLIFTGFLPQMARAAEKAGAQGTNNLSAVDGGLATEAQKLVAVLSDRTGVSMGPGEWTNTASTLRNWSSNPPVEFRAFLCVALVTVGRTDFALAELELIGTNQLSSSNAILYYHGGRAVLYGLQGWSHLANSEADVGMRHVATTSPVTGQQLVGGFHILQAVLAFQDHEWMEVDAQVAHSIRAWPDNPWAVFLTGEKLAANGEWEKAAESLEKRAAGTEDAALAAKLAQRARDIRDGKGAADALVFDARFLISLVPHIAARSSVGEKVKQVADEAAAFGRRLVDKVPLIGGE